jgi:N-acetylglucosaminyl-diphospho-decaprenol L-rhamnosyltransferase
MRVAVVIVNYRTPEMVVACLERLDQERSLLASIEAVVVDNASGDDSAALLSARLGDAQFAEWVQFLPLPLNGGFGWGNNEAILSLLARDMPPEAILLLNPDTMIEPGAAAALVRDMQARPNAAAIGSQLVNQDGTLAGSAFRFPSISREFLRGLGIAKVGRLLRIAPVLVPLGEVGPVDWVTGASVLIRTQALRDAGMFDSGFFLYFEEVELMHRFAVHGWKCYHCPESRVVHVAGASTGIVDGRLAGKRAPPDYLFHSRHRYFALTGGRLSAWLADVAWLAGSFCARIIGMLTPKRSTIDTDAEREALLRIGLGARRKDVRAAITPTTGMPGHPPSWMTE